VDKFINLNSPVVFYSYEDVNFARPNKEIHCLPGRSPILVCLSDELIDAKLRDNQVFHDFLVFLNTLSFIRIIFSICRGKYD